jgi:hypothetical protein
VKNLKGVASVLRENDCVHYVFTLGHQRLGQLAAESVKCVRDWMRYYWCVSGVMGKKPRRG